MSKLEVNKQEVVNIYNNSTSEQKEVMKKLFGEFFDVRERVKTFEDACNELGKDHVFFKEYVLCQENGCSNDLIAYLKLRIITAALNEGWEPDWTNSNEWKYYPWLCLYTEDEYNDLDADDKERCCRVVGRSNYSANASGGLVYAYASHASSGSVAYHGSRFAFKTRELALYAGKQFVDIYSELNGIWKLL